MKILMVPCLSSWLTIINDLRSSFWFDLTLWGNLSNNFAHQDFAENLEDLVDLLIDLLLPARCSQLLHVRSFDQLFVYLFWSNVSLRYRNAILERQLLHVLSLVMLGVQSRPNRRDLLRKAYWMLDLSLDLLLFFSTDLFLHRCFLDYTLFFGLLFCRCYLINAWVLLLNIIFN